MKALLLLLQGAQAITYLGCYSSVPGLSSQGVYMYQSSGHCGDVCVDSYVVALSNGNECFCGNRVPSGSGGASCTTHCSGYPQEMCGSSSAYTVYLNPAYADDEEGGDDDDDSSSSGSGDASSSSDSSSSQDDNDSSSTSESAGSSASSGSPTTSGSSSSSSSSSSTSSSSSRPTSSTSSSSSSSASSSSQSSSSQQSTATESSTAIYSSQVVIVSTSVSPTRTQTSVVTVTQAVSTTVDPSDSATASSSSSAENHHDSTGSRRLGGGAIAGIVIGAVAGVGIISALAFLIIRRRHQDDVYSLDEKSEYIPPTLPPSINNDFNFAPPAPAGTRRISLGSLDDSAVEGPRRELRVINPDLNPSRSRIP